MKMAYHFSANQGKGEDKKSIHEEGMKQWRLVHPLQKLNYLQRNKLRFWDVTKREGLFNAEENRKAAATDTDTTGKRNYKVKFVCTCSNCPFDFEDQYSPRKLGNWEYPKWYPERPRQRFKSTKIIADDCGRLLEGVKKGGNAWGNYVGTWDLPRRITRDYVKKLVAPDERLIKRWSQKKKEAVEIPQEPADSEKEEKYLQTCDYLNSSAEKSFQRRNKSSSALDLRPRSTKLEPLVALEKKEDIVQNIKPEHLNENIQKILDSVQEKQEPKVEVPPDIICKEIKALPKSSKRRGSDVEKELKRLGSLKGLERLPEVNYPYNYKADEEKMEKSTKVVEKKESLKTNEPSYQIAKRYHDENLRHKPLPDVVGDPIFKALTNEGHSEVLKIDSGPSAIGWKPYTAPRPTECSKLKVFRPKTALDKVKLQKDSRPKTSAYKKRFLPIDLAICWDLKPDDPSDEPKRSPHIDGSNGSVAPAVFTMIKPSVEEEEQPVPGSSQPVAEKILQGIDENNVVTLPSQVNEKSRAPLSLASNKEAIMSCVRSSQNGTPKHKGTPDSLNSISPNAAEYARKNPKTAWTNEDTSKALSDRLQCLQNGKYQKSSRSPSESSQVLKKNHHQSTPNLATVCDGSHCGTEKSSPGSMKSNGIIKPRPCESANVSGSDIDKSLKAMQKNRHCSACKKPNYNCDENRPKEEFKSAFKAGVPKSESFNSGSSSTAKSYKVPKMRLPYAKRSYSIGTLVPPFSIWRESHGQEYPEHWRLASVYQHSYKPVNCRRRPLLASVYQ